VVVPVVQQHVVAEAGLAAVVALTRSVVLSAAAEVQAAAGQNSACCAQAHVVQQVRHVQMQADWDAPGPDLSVWACQACQPRPHHT
jgi:hypothetical protein